MSREETKVIIAAMIASYPNYKPADLGITVDTWTLMLEEYDYKLVQMALKTYITTDTSGFAPSIGQLVDKIHTMREMVSETNESSVWTQVMKAIGNSNYHAQEEYEKLDPIAQKVLGSPEQLKVMARDEDFNESVQKSLFMRNYTQMKNKQKEFDRLPQDVKQVIAIQGQQMKGIEG